MSGDPHVPELLTHRAWPLFDVLVELTTLLLPRGEMRRRYRQEHQAELRQFSPAGQARYVLGVLLSAWTLRRAVTGEPGLMIEPAKPRKPLLCLLNLHHRWRSEHVVNEGFFLRCVRCGKDDPGPLIDKVGDIIAQGSAGGGAGG